MKIKDIASGLLGYIRDNAAIKWIGLPLLAFFPMALAFPADSLIKWLSWILVVIAVGVVSTYFVAVWHAFRNTGPMPRYTHLALGIFLGWFSIVMNRTWVGVIRLYPLELWMRNSYFIPFYIWVAIMAGVFHMTAPGAINGVVPTENWIKIGVAVMIGLVLGILITVIIGGSNVAASLDLMSYLVRS